MGLLLSLPVIFYSCWIFFDGAVRALRARTLDMMVLVAVGSGWLYTGLSAKRGVLFKNAMALETSARIQVVVMDKTGTLTKGEPEVTTSSPTASTKTSC